MDNGFGLNPQEQQPAQQYTPQEGEVENGHKAVDATMDGLIKLVSLPKGELTKKQIFDEASTMIAHGAFPTPESKQQLIGKLATLPDDEDGMRKMLGQFLLSVSAFRSHYHNAFGPPQPNQLEQAPV